MIKRSLFLVAIVFFSCSQKEEVRESVEVKSEPTQVRSNKTNNALSFINAYVENCNRIKQSLPISEWVNSNNLSTVNFKSELKKIIDEADDESGLEFDPIFNAQDYPENGFDLDTFDETTSFLVVKGKDNPAFKITMKLAEEKGKWLVDGCGCINVPNDKRAL